MAKCNKIHVVKKMNNKIVEVPCYYIAGICVVDPIHQGLMEMFLRSTYPFFHSSKYEESKKMQSTIVPNNIVFANENLW